MSEIIIAFGRKDTWEGYTKCEAKDRKSEIAAYRSMGLKVKSYSDIIEYREAKRKWLEKEI